MSWPASVDFLSWASIAGVDEILKLMFFKPYFGMAESLVAFVSPAPASMPYRVLSYSSPMVLRSPMVRALESLLTAMVSLALSYQQPRFSILSP